MLKIGDKVRLVQPVISGTVLSAMTDGEQFGYMVAFTDASGNDQQRFLPQDAVELASDTTTSDQQA